jgi:hypothetical protein
MTQQSQAPNAVLRNQNDATQSHASGPVLKTAALAAGIIAIAVATA